MKKVLLTVLAVLALVFVGAAPANVVNETDCRLANSGLDGNPLLLVGGAVILTGAGAWLVLRRKKA